ncbi:MAG: pyridoxal phosphate-dependent aminotransferase family protein [Holophagales bacterium]|nr:pyridoxal phosphate-dependent aminotransferase family protein [Holophagales bacterium]
MTKSMARFFPGRGPIPQRNSKLLEWVRRRNEAGLWPYGVRADEPIAPELVVEHPSGARIRGINMTTVDYLGLCQDPRLGSAAIRAVEREGFHMPSSGPLMGNTPASNALERRLAGLFERQDAFLCPTGWAAGFAAIAGMVRQNDAVLMDELAHQCLQQAAYASTTNVQCFRHLDNGDLERRLKSLRERDASNAVVVITEGLFSMDGDSPDLRELTALCRRYEALSVVDVAHDFGATGPGGTGTIGEQSVFDQVDVVVGSFSKVLGTNGGFVASREPAVQWAQLCFGGPYTYSTTLSPVQVAVASTALDLITSDEGARLREALQDNVAYIRAGAADRGLTVLGSPSPIVPIFVGSAEQARLAGLRSFQKGLIATCLEFPVVKQGAARYRLSLSPRFTRAQLDRACCVLAESIGEAMDSSERP